MTYQFNSTEVLRLSKEGIWANPDIPVDEAAMLVLAAIDQNIKLLVEKALAEEREACAKVCDDLHPGLATKRAAEIIRARSNK